MKNNKKLDNLEELEMQLYHTMFIIPYKKINKHPNKKKRQIVEGVNIKKLEAFHFHSSSIKMNTPKYWGIHFFHTSPFLNILYCRMVLIYEYRCTKIWW